MSLNVLSVVGRLIEAPIAIQSQFPGCKFRIASNHRYKTKAGEQKEEVLYLECTVWGKRAEGVMNLQKGAEVFVSGRLKSSKFTNKSGVEQMKTEMTVDDIIFQEKLGLESNSQAPRQESYQPKQPPAPKQQPQVPQYPKQAPEFEDFEYSDY